MNPIAEQRTDGAAGEQARGEDSRWREVRFRHSPSFAEVLEHMRCTLLVSTYQAGKLIAVGRDGEGGINFSFHEFDQTMGVAANAQQIAVGARGQIWFLADNSQLAGSIPPAGRYDRCYLARSATVTGGIHCHELAWGQREDGEPELWVVNTLFSCLAGLHPDYSFVPRWRPPFITALADEDRCHLNGLAMREGRPAYVTVMARTDTPGGWREDKNSTGCVLDVATGEPVTQGLAMPHSPRWHEGRLLVLNSGWGTLEAVDLGSGERTVIESVPGYSRGLACHGNLAFIGLSRIRETAIFGGVPIAERHDELKCGVGVVDLHTGATVATLEFESGVEEIFDVQVLPETHCVALGGHRPGGEENREIWVVPPSGGRAQVGAAGPRAAAPDHDRPPTDAQIGTWVASALRAQEAGRAPEAVELLRRAAAARPDSPEIENHLGNALQDAGQQERALAAYERAANADPTFGPALQNRGYLLISQGRTEEGIRQLRRAQEINPLDLNRVMIATALPVIYPCPGDVASFRKRIESSVGELVEEGLEIDTTNVLLPTNFFAAYQGFNDRELHENLGRIYQGVDLTESRSRSRTDGRRRIGFISAYFRDHTIGRLNLGRIQHLDRERFEVVVISATQARDPIARAFESAADRFVRIPREAAAARRIVAEQDLDLLLFTDVGMDALTYTLAFSRMAPIQCASWGHPVTTGSRAIDCFISSELLEGAEADDHYSEELIRLASLGTYYERPAVAALEGARADLGLEEGANLYVCPQTLFKLHPTFDAICAQILRGDPKGRLVLIEGRVERWTALLRERFERTMPDVLERIRWLPAMPRERFLRLLATADVVLDPTVFGGGNTSYEALAMGTPIVTMPGELMRSRITRALYEKAGFVDLVVDSPEQYIDVALQLGTEPSSRQEVRKSITDSCGVLYEDEAEVRDLEEGLFELLGEAQVT